MNDSLDLLMQAMPAEYRGRWCDARACGCLGCANHSGGLVRAGFTREDWRAWLEKRMSLPGWFEELFKADDEVGMEQFGSAPPRYFLNGVEVFDPNREPSDMSARICRVHHCAMQTDGAGRFWCDDCNHEQRLGYMSDHPADCRCELHRFAETHGRVPTLAEIRQFQP